MFWIPGLISRKCQSKPSQRSTERAPDIAERPTFRAVLTGMCWKTAQVSFSALLALGPSGAMRTAMRRGVAGVQHPRRQLILGRRRGPDRVLAAELAVEQVADPVIDGVANSLPGRVA